MRITRYARVWAGGGSAGMTAPRGETYRELLQPLLVDGKPTSVMLRLAGFIKEARLAADGR